MLQFLTGLFKVTNTEQINLLSTILCPNCGKTTKVLLTRQNGREIKLCWECGWNYTYDWVNENVIKAADVIDAAKHSKLSLKPELSIVILSYNALQITVKCLLSVLKNVKDVSFEIILVDNASSEIGMKEVLSELSKSIPGLTVYYNKINEGVAKGRNQGASHAKGKYLLFLDNDMVLLKPTELKDMAELLSSGKASIVGFPEKVKGNTNEPCYRPFILGGFCMVKKSKVRIDENYKEFWWDDADFTFTCVKEFGLPFAVVKKNSVFHIGNITGNQLRKGNGVDYNKLEKENREYLNKKWR